MKSRALELMQLHDHELGEREAVELERSLTDEELAMLDGLEQVGDVVRALGEQTGAHAGDIAAAVMARIDEAPAAANAVRRLEAPLASERRGRGKVLAFGLALAAAAAAVLWLETSRHPVAPAPVAQTTLRAPVPEPPPPNVVAPPQAPESTEDEPAPAASIEAVDFGNNAGTIFMVPSGDESTPVVWLVDEPAGGRMEQL
jgi:hypothetical protein